MVEFMQATAFYHILDIPIEKPKLQSLPRPLIYLSDSSDEDDCEMKVEDQPNNSVTYHRLSPSIYSEYYRKKFNSVKLTLNDATNSCPKRAVRFADEFGLELSQTKMIDTDEVPSIPDEAFKHLKITHEHYPPIQEHMIIITYMEQQFKNPISSQNFYDRLSQQKILLEQANVIDNRIDGTVRSVSFGLHKRVKIRLTTDNWISFQDYDAQYITNSHDGNCDRFSFTIEIDIHRMFTDNTIQFCISYECSDGPKYWDNNSEENYQFNCLSRTILDDDIN